MVYKFLPTFAALVVPEGLMPRFRSMQHSFRWDQSRDPIVSCVVDVPESFQYLEYPVIEVD